MLALLSRVATEGLPRNTEISHQIKGKLFEFIQGRLRFSGSTTKEDSLSAQVVLLRRDRKPLGVR